jgi:hypothetical protein
MSDCSCTSKYENSGLTSCIGALIKVSRRIIMVPKYADDGTLNKVTLPATINSAYVTALINQADRSKRWYPLPKHVGAEITKGESTFETHSDNSKSFIHVGVSSFKATYPDMQPFYLNVLKSGRCTDMACYIVDKSGALVGLTNGEENVLYPFSLNRNTTDAIYMFATDTTTSKIALSFEFDTDQADENISKIDAVDMVGVNLLLSSFDGLYDAIKSQTSTGQTSMVFKLYAKSGSAASPVAITGLLAANFALYNVTDLAAVTVSTAVESTTVPGTYTLTYASQTVADVIRITPTKTGVDFTDVIAATATVV